MTDTADATPVAEDSSSTSSREGASDRPRLADGVELIGEMEDSGYREPPSLARRSDGQVIQMTPILQAIANAADGERDFAGMAEAASDETGRDISAENVQKLVDEKLRPLGVLTLADGSSPTVEKSDPLLALRLRFTLIPERWSRQIASVFRPLFWPPVVVAVLVGLVAFDIWLFGVHGVAQGFRSAMYDPVLMLVIVGLVVLSAGWHEFGHAAGCAYGGGKPGRMGGGIYLAYPAFYTDVTDTYRLPRGGRLRTDLAGVYFNGLFILALAGLYFLTGWEAVLVAVLIQHIEAVHQLLPVIRLDGYYVIADLTGVPDMFARIKPIMASVLPWRKPDEKVTQLKPWVRFVVSTWVLVIVPLLAFQLLTILLHLPRIMATAADSVSKQLGTISEGGINTISGVVGALIVVLPMVGLGVTFIRLVPRLWKWGWSASENSTVGRGAFSAAFITAIAMLLYVWVPNGDYDPFHPGERGTLPETVEAISYVPSGQGGVASRERAREAGVLDQEFASAGLGDAFGQLLGAQGTEETLQPGTTGPDQNYSVVENTRDGSSVFDIAFSVKELADEYQSPENVAIAYANCESCRSVAIAIQIVLVTGVQQPGNVAIAVNDRCTSCETLAVAYQFVFGGSRPTAQRGHRGGTERAPRRLARDSLRRGDVLREASARGRQGHRRDRQDHREGSEGAGQGQGV